MAAHLQAPESNRPANRTEPEDPAPTDLFELLGDEYTRRVYEAVAEEPRCGRAVAEAADVSRPTAYRRLNDLCEAGLVRAEIAVRLDGHHRKRFEAVTGSVSVSFDEDGIEAMVDAAD